MSVKDFNSSVAAKQRKEFTVAGQKFAARPKLAWRTYSRLIDSITSDKLSEEEAARQFFNTVLIKADRARFISLLSAEEGDDDEGSEVISNEQVVEISQWLISEYRGGKASETTES